MRTFLARYIQPKFYVPNGLQLTDIYTNDNELFEKLKYNTELIKFLNKEMVSFLRYKCDQLPSVNPKEIIISFKNDNMEVLIANLELLKINKKKVYGINGKIYEYKNIAEYLEKDCTDLDIDLKQQIRLYKLSNILENTKNIAFSSCFPFHNTMILKVSKKTFISFISKWVIPYSECPGLCKFVPYVLQHEI